MLKVFPCSGQLLYDGCLFVRAVLNLAHCNIRNFVVSTKTDDIFLEHLIEFSSSSANE